MSLLHTEPCRNPTEGETESPSWQNFTYESYPRLWRPSTFCNVLCKLINNGYVGSDTHRILFNRWIQLTFGLLAGGHTEYQNSAEALQRIDHVRRFITKLVGPYCVQRHENGNFSENLDDILQISVALGYHLMGVAEKYRWDWTWLAPMSKVLGHTVIGEPPPRRPREEEVPEGIWITAPALVKETNAFGQQLAIKITLMAAKQSELYPPSPQIMKHWDQEAEDEFERSKGDVFHH